MSDERELQEALEEIIRRLEAAKQHLYSANSDLNFTNARINGYIATAQSAARAALSTAREERDETDT